MHKSTNPLTHDKEQLSVLLYLTHYHPVCCFEDTVTKRPMLSESKARNSRTNRRRNLHFGLCYYWLLMYKTTAYL